MRNSLGGLGDIPSPGKAGVPPASARSRQARARGRVCGRQDRPFRQRVIAVCRALPWCDPTPKYREQREVASVGLCPLRPGPAGDVQRRLVPRRGWEMLDIGNGGTPHFQEAVGSHFQPICWKWKKSREAASSICPTMAAIQIWSSRYRTRGGIEISSSRYRTRVSKIIALTRIPPENQWIRQLFRNEQRRPFARTIVILPDNERDDLGAILSQGD